jgi:hypothetical protein
MTAKLEIVQGMGKFLHTTLEGIIPDLNTDLASKIKTQNSVTSPPVFSVAEGEILSLPHPVLAAKYAWKDPRRDGNSIVDITVAYRIMCLVPVAGPNTSMAFEMARRVASDHVASVFLDDTRVLLPVIDGGIIKPWKAMGAQIGREDDIFPALMPDKQTTAHGWMTTYSATFSLNTR